MWIRCLFKCYRSLAFGIPCSIFFHLMLMFTNGPEISTNVLMTFLSISFSIVANNYTGYNAL